MLSSHVNGYQSVAAFDPKPGRDVPPFRIFDLDAPRTTLKTILRDYDSVVQNLRLIERPGVSRWTRRDRRWSEAALAEDDRGRVLFVISATPMTMPDFNRSLLALDIGVVAAQHLEGGSWAQLAVNVGEARFEVVGNSGRARAIPSVLGLRPRASR